MYTWDIGTNSLCANSVDPDQLLLKEQSDEGLHFLPFCLYLLGTQIQCSNVGITTAIVLDIPIIRFLK